MLCRCYVLCHSGEAVPAKNNLRGDCPVTTHCRTVPFLAVPAVTIGADCSGGSDTIGGGISGTANILVSRPVLRENGPATAFVSPAAQGRRGSDSEGGPAIRSPPFPMSSSPSRALKIA